jgi:hypothetical protein
MIAGRRGGRGRVKGRVGWYDGEKLARILVCHTSKQCKARGGRWTNKKVNKWGGEKRKEEKKKWEKSE